MDEVDVEGKPIFHSIEQKMKDDMNRVLFTEPSKNLCSYILKDIETWMANKFEHSDEPTSYRQDRHIKIFSKTTDQRKSQQQVKFGAYAKSLVKNLCVVNPNEATEDFDCAPSRPEKQRINVSYATVVASPVHRMDFADTTTENIDLTTDDPSLLTVSTIVTKLMELERSIKTIELDRESLNTAQSTLSSEMKQVINTSLGQSK
jgi:hypothetical protein